MPALGLALGLPYGRSASAIVGPLDAYAAGMAGAWSVFRRLLGSWTGALVRVRRSGDNAEADFDADGLGALNKAALTAWVIAGGGTQNGYVRRIYSQTGGASFGQATAANQPIIVNGGTLVTEDGTPGGIPAAQWQTARDCWLEVESSVAARSWIVTARLESAIDYAGLLTGIGGTEYLLLGSAPPVGFFASNLPGGSIYVDGVNTNSPFGYDTRCFSITGDLTDRVWMWGTDRGIAARYFEGPCMEMVLLSNTTDRAAVETVLMEGVGL